MSQATCGPLAVLSTLTAAKQGAEQLAKACCDALAHLDAALRAQGDGSSKGAPSSDWVQALVRAVTGRLSDKVLTEALLQQYGEVLARCLQHQQLSSGAQPASCLATYVACYRCTRLLLAQKAAAVACSHAWRLHKHAAEAAAAGWDLPPAMQEAAIGSGLTFLICSCEQLEVAGGVLPQLLEVCQAVLDLIRQQGPDKALQHADTLFKYLSKVLSGVQDAAADAEATAGLAGCLVQAMLASPQADKLSQVMLKAINQLPPQLSWCGLAGVMVWATSQPSHDSTTASSSNSSDCVWQCADAMLEWAVRHRRCGTWATSLSSWAQGLESSSSSSSTRAAGVLAACLPILLRAAGPDGITEGDTQQLQQCTGQMNPADNSSSKAVREAPQQQQSQQQPSKGRGSRQARSVQKQAADDGAQASGGADDSERAMLLLHWCLCKLGGMLQQRQQLSSNKTPAAAGPKTGAVVLQLLLEALAAAAGPAGAASLQVQCQLVHAAGTALAAATASASGSSSSSSSNSRTGHKQQNQQQWDQQCQQLIEAVIALCAAAGSGTTGTTHLKQLAQTGGQLLAAGGRLQRASEVVPASCLLWCGWRLQAVALQLSLSSSSSQEEVAPCCLERHGMLQEVVAAAKAVLTASGSSSSKAEASSSEWLQQEQQLRDVLVDTVLLVVQAQLPALQHEQQLAALFKGWARHMRGAAAAAGAASHTVVQWLQQQQQHGGLGAQQGPLLLLSQQVDCIIAVDLRCLQEQAAAGKLPADKAGAAMSAALQLATEVLPAGWQQQHWEAQVQLLQAIRHMQCGSTAADVTVQLDAACDTFGAILNSQDGTSSRSDGAASAAGGGRGGGGGSGKRRCKKQASMQQGAQAQDVGRADMVVLLSSSGLAYCLQGMHLHQQKQQQQQQQQEAGGDSTATDDATHGASPSSSAAAAATAGGGDIQEILCQAAGCWLRCCSELPATASTTSRESDQQQQRQLQACAGAWRLPVECAAAAAEAASTAGSRGWLPLEQQLRQITSHLAALQVIQQQPTPGSNGNSRRSATTITSSSSSSSGPQGREGGSSVCDYWLGRVLGGVSGGDGEVVQEQVDLADALSGMTLAERGDASANLAPDTTSTTSSSAADELLAAAYGAFHRGDTLAAVHHAEAAAKCCYRAEGPHKGFTAAGAGSACASTRWDLLRSYCAVCWLLGQLMEVLGQPDGAVDWFKQLQQVAAGLGSAALGAVAAAGIAWVQARRGDAARAASALQNAQRHWEQWQLELASLQEGTALSRSDGAAAAEECAEQQQDDPVRQLLCAAVHSWLLVAQAEQALLLKELPAAAVALQSALDQLTHSLGSATPQEEPSCSSLVVAAVQQQAAISSRLAHCKRLQADMSGAGRAVLEGLQQLAAAAQQLGRPLAQHFAMQQAALQLQLCQLQAQGGSPQPTSGSHGLQVVLPLQLAGCSCSSSHDLSQEFVGLAVGSEEQQVPAGSRPRKGAARCKGGQGTHEAEVPAVGSLQLLQQLLQLLPAARAAPLLLRHACQLLTEVCRREEALPAAAMFLQLSIGASAQQQHLLHTQRIARKAGKASTASRRASAAAVPAAQVWRQAGELLGLEDLLCRVVHCCSSNGGDDAPAASSKRSKGGRGRSGTGSSSSRAPAAGQGPADQQDLTGLLQQLDGVAGAWLESMLEQLPPGCALTSVSCCGEAAEAQALLLCRCSRGQTPLLVMLHQLEGAKGGKPGIRPVTELTQRLADTLAASSASMAGTATLTSVEGKAAWWHQRTALDTAMRQLLHDLGSSWLGPWRCLLLPGPGGQEATAAAAAAAGELVEEQFGAILEGASLVRLSQLVSLLLPHRGQMAPDEVATAALHLCQLTQTRADGGQVQQLADALCKTHAGLPGAAAASNGRGAGCSGPGPGTKLGSQQQQQPTPRRPLQEVNAGLTSAANRSSNSSSRESSAAAAGQAGGEATGPPPVTPAASKAFSRLGAPPTIQRSTVGRSRFGSMQQSTPARPPQPQGGAAAGGGAGDLSDAFVQRLQLEEVGQGPVVDQEPPTPAAAGAATGRRVRFCQEAPEAAGGSNTCLVPPSVARHGMRRNKLPPPDADPAVAAATVPASCVQAAAAEGFTTPAVKPKRGSRLAGMSTGKPQGSSSRVFSMADRLQQAAAAAEAADQAGRHAPAATGARHSRQAQQSEPAQSAEPTRSACEAGARSSGSSSSSTGGASCGLLVLDAQLQVLPWEALPGLQQHELYRCPNMAVAAALALRARHLPAASDADSSAVSAGADAEGAATPAAVGEAVLRAGTSYYVLNPDGDLPDTQATFEPWLQDSLHLQGVSGCRPAATDLAGALEQHDLFLYFGHGSGEQYLPLMGLRRLARCSGCLLLGCSSGRLRSNGMYEPSGPVLGYLMAGCPAAVANLWDVTDRDIDRFGEVLLQNWLGSNPTSAEASGRGRSSSSSSSSKRKAAKPAAAGHCSASRGGGVAGVVNDSREACRLQWLIGAAPVCYGVPTRVLPAVTQE